MVFKIAEALSVATSGRTNASLIVLVGHNGLQTKPTYTALINEKLTVCIGNLHDLIGISIKTQVDALNPIQGAKSFLVSAHQ